MKMDIQKNSLERIRIQRSEYKGHELIDIRVYENRRRKSWQNSAEILMVSITVYENRRRNKRCY